MGTVIYHAKEDPKYQKPFIDIDETRSRVTPAGKELPFRYLHGGFEGTPVKFSFCLPSKEDFSGCFFHLLSPFPGPDEEMASLQLTGEDDWAAFALTYNTAFVESNMGSMTAFGPNGDDTDRWKTSAAVTEFFRDKVMELYGCPRPIGIVYGGSGGGFKTMACAENTDAWDGAVPFVIGSPAALPNSIALHAQGMRLLRGKFQQVLDNVDVGSGVSPYEGLDHFAADMLKEVTRMGFPPRAWFLEAWGHEDPGSLPVLLPGIKMQDPAFFEEFWVKPGYLGSDPNSHACRDRIYFETTVTEVHVPGKKEAEGFDSRNDVNNAFMKMMQSGDGAWIAVDRLPEGDDLYTLGTQMQFLTGGAQGTMLFLGEIIRNPEGEGGILTIGNAYGADDMNTVMSRIQPGDTLRLDNSDFIALQSYYMHQVPKDRSFHAWDQFRNEDGTPKYVQRAREIGPGFNGTGTTQDGNIQCPLMVVQSLMDEMTFPWSADWYRHKVIETKGNEDTFRLYYNERTMHGPVAEIKNTQVIHYGGILRQALLDMKAWIQEGKEPQATSSYTYDDGQIYVPADAKDRRGMQQTICFTANGGERAEVKCGEPVQFELLAMIPGGVGEITSVEVQWDDTRIILDPNAFPEKVPFEKTEKDGLHGATASLTHSYDEPGTHFASVLVKSQRSGDADEVYTQICNIARVRVVVE